MSDHNAPFTARRRASDAEPGFQARNDIACNRRTTLQYPGRESTRCDRETAIAVDRERAHRRVVVFEPVGGLASAASGSGFESGGGLGMRAEAGQLLPWSGAPARQRVPM
jgi:hypothetical protein